jgi:branched-chain amino acid aminotransferase
LTEVFACGTAAVITPVGSVLHADGRFEINGGEPGPVTLKLRQELTDLQYGRRADTHHWLTRLD